MLGKKPHERPLRLSALRVKWVTLEENMLRQRVSTEIATKGGQFDILTIGAYEVPIGEKQRWLVPLMRGRPFRAHPDLR